MIVFGRILLHKRNTSTIDSTAVSVSELSTTVDAMTKLQSNDAIVVTTMTTDAETTTNNATNIIRSDLTATNDENTENTSDIDLTTPLSIPSISSRNNVS